MTRPSHTKADMPKTPEELESFIERVIAKKAAGDENIIVVEKTEAVAPANLPSPEERLLRSIFGESASLDAEAPAQVDPPIRHSRLETIDEALLTRAIEVFGARDTAVDWVYEPNPALDGKTPFEVYSNPEGRDEIFRILGRIENGVIS